MGYWSPISDTEDRIHSAQQDSPVSKIIFTLFSLFSVDQVLASQIKTEEEISWVRPPTM